MKCYVDRSVDNTTGIREENGTWNGLVGMLLRDEIDFVVSELNINQERTDVMDFSHPLLKTRSVYIPTCALITDLKAFFGYMTLSNFECRYQVYFRQPGYNLAWSGVLQPFHRHLWLALLSWILVGAVVLSVCTRGVHPYNSPSDLSLQPSTTLFFMFQSMCQQGM